MPSNPPILLVEDNQTLLLAYQLLLEELGFVVLRARSGDEAVSISSEHVGDVKAAIVDLKMPGLDGPGTIAALQTQRPGLKIISVSGDVLSPYFSRLADLGVRHFLPKPMVMDDLLDTMRDLSIAA
jgi:CheY-like chemotaxis protein